MMLPSGADAAGRGDRDSGPGNFGRLLVALTLGLLVQGFGVPAGIAQTEAPRTPVVEEVPPRTETRAERDSLMREIKAYTRLINSLRDSVSIGDAGGLQLSPAQRERIESNISDIGNVVESISQELSRMEFEIRDNTISLVNESGEGIVINVPEDLDTQVSQGIKALTEVILNELPDSVDFDHSRRWDWSSFRPEPPAAKRRVINGNIVKVWQDVQISAKEDVRGNVVVVFGDAEVAGRVDGTVVTVFGSLRLTETADVTGSVVAVGGYLDQDPASRVEDVVAINPLSLGRGDDWHGMLEQDGIGFLISQGTFLLSIFLAAGVVAIIPRSRFDAITGALKAALMPATGVGVLTALGGHILAAVLMAVLVLTVIGVPLALLVGLGLLLLVVVSVAVTGAVVGERLCGSMGGRCRQAWLLTVVGMSALHLVSFFGALLGVLGAAGTLAAAVTALGIVIKLFAYLAGLGALVLSRFGRRAPAA